MVTHTQLNYDFMVNLIKKNVCNYVSVIFLCDDYRLFIQYRVRFMSCDYNSRPI